MDLLTLQNQIRTHSLFNFYIFAGTETAIAGKYLQMMSKTLNKPIFRMDDINACLDTIAKISLLDEPRLYVVQDDKVFMRNPGMWRGVPKRLKSHTLVMLYSKMDKKSKFFKDKENAKYCVPFEPQPADILAESIVKVVPLSKEDATHLADICDCSYGRCMLEADKIKNYMDSQIAAGVEMTPHAAFSHLLEIDAIYRPVSEVTFKMVDAIMNRNNLKAIQAGLLHMKEQRESRLGVLTLLYNNFRNQLMYQSLGSNTDDAAERTGMTAYQCRLARYRSGRYSGPELKRALDIIQDLEFSVKTGLIDEAVSLDYFVAQVI